MRRYSHCLGDRLLLMPPGSTQSSPFPPLGSTRPRLPARVHLATKVTRQKRVGTLESDALLLLLFQTRLMTVYDHVTSAMQRVAETNLHGALDDEELFIIEGST